jgi:hypothetical protein
MSPEYAFPPAVLLGLWLNAAQTGSVSKTDAANALEAITEQVDVQIVNNSVELESSWLELVRAVASAAEPVAVGLPVPGDPAGVPVGVLATISVDSGVVAINRTQVLCQDSNAEWILMNETNNVLHYDLSQTRRSLMEQISESANQLAASDLVGDETEILAALESFRTLHIPPHVSKRSTEALELAARVNIIASGAIRSASALHSPSIDRQRVIILQNLITESRAVLQSVVAF